MPDDTDHDLIALTADIVAAQVAANRVDVSEVGPLIAAVHAALSGLGKAPEPVANEPRKGAVSARASIKAGGLVSMIDGRLYKTLKRHIGRHGYTPESYRKAFGLPHDYPMVSSAYSATRSELAKALGLGRKAMVKPVAKAAATLGDALASARQHLGDAEQAVVKGARRKLKAKFDTKSE